MFDRLKIIIGDKVDFFNDKTVLLFGLGGVGGSAFEALVRMGIGKIIIVDNDVFDITNLNRQALSFRRVIGKNKVDVAKEIALEINPRCEVISYKIFADERQAAD